VLDHHIDPNGKVGELGRVLPQILLPFALVRPRFVIRTFAKRTVNDAELAKDMDAFQPSPLSKSKVSLT
jgi:hypothetical protein